MPICAVIDLNNGQLVNTIIADVTDLPPDNCKLVEIPEGFYWDNAQSMVLPISVNEITDGN